MRRLYSTFAGGWPGIGLLGMRLISGSVVVVHTNPILWRDPPTVTAISSILSFACGLLLIPGLWTPLAGGLLALLEAWQTFRLTADPWASLLLGTIGGALAMLGPGLFSVDARLFGWKRVEAPPRKASPISH